MPTDDISESQGLTRRWEAPTDKALRLAVGSTADAPTDARSRILSPQYGDGDDGSFVIHSRVEIVSVDEESAFWQDGDTIRSCLLEFPPRIPGWFGYDAVGSQLFEEITELPSYYVTRVEHDLLGRHRDEIAELLDGRIAELGSGSAKKTRLLLAACCKRRPTTYLPVDVTREMLASSGEALADEFSDLRVIGLWGRYQAALAWLREPGVDRRRLDGGRDSLTVAFLGNSLGNITPLERDALLDDIAATLQTGDHFLISVDLEKPAPVVEVSYNDPPGESPFARFWLNDIDHLNRRFEGNLLAHGFYSRAHYNSASATIEHHLYATEDQTATLAKLGVTLELKRGDSISTGFSAKFHRPRFVAEVSSRGFVLAHQWIDPVWQYGIFLFTHGCA